MSIEKVLELYGIGKKKIEKHSESEERAVWTINDMYILKESKTKNAIDKNIKITNMLIQHKIPVQNNLKSLAGQDYIEYNSKYYALYEKIKGHTITDYFYGDYEKQAYYIGQCIGRLHVGLKDIYDETDNDEIDDSNMINEVNGWAHSEIQDFLAKGTVSDCETAEFSKLLRYISSDFAELYNMLPRQIIHRDMHGENMIFEESNFKGFIDFDLSQINARIYDPCYMCTAALSTVFDKEEITKWPLFAYQIVKGYDDIIQLTDIEKQSIKPMMILNEIIMTAFFYKYGYQEIAHTNLKMALYINKVIK